MNNIKEKIISEIEKTVSVFHKVSPIRYRIRCPFCGDSGSDPNDSHLYLLADENPLTPITYYCFKGNCGAHGIVGKDFMERLGIHVDGLETFNNRPFNRISRIKKSDIKIITGDPIMNSFQVKYIEERLGKGFTYEDYDKFKIIWDMNVLYPIIEDRQLKNTLPSNRNSVTFLSDDKSVILTRFFNGEGEHRWKKSKLFSLDTKSFYTIKTVIDLFTKDKLIINIAEGIFDILSVYKNFYDPGIHVHIASLGADYVSALNYAIGNGFIGNNVFIRIYIDSNIDAKALRKKLKRYVWLVNSIEIIKNIKSEDFGVHIDEIDTVEYHV